jgi:lipoprotein-releasing system ATP-binding protein
MELENIHRFFGVRETKVSVLTGVNLKIKKGEIVALVGPSGSGKSTLLHIAGLLDKPNKGRLFLDGKEIAMNKDKSRTNARREYIGFVYQAHLLLPDFSALENVMIPQLVAGKSEKVAHVRAEELLTRVGLSHRFKHRSGQLSGGEQQRVAIARALANDPHLLLADEPTGNLDPVTAAGVFEELLKLVRQTGLSALIATHNPELASKMDRRVCVQEGVIKELP